ncbi:ribosomal protein L23-domain-containing protein [Cokeromyces recurvatus]|uniref:ribosomal protein L23-domain-containing protein n=1 Tax=Cokeromyces recurvatus TaxID=90255 RepID=UPI00221E8A1E|nr:ribosomal protein L23-domain-containing protein [Cokeromyces recurvatus]KAI7903709.1 ribosomal protein L23-domain-containing protein [Cokeromyces recurvatus]
MVRSPNLEPNQVAFRIPSKCNKFDIHSYLTNIYGVNVQEVRTMNYATMHKKGRNGMMSVSQPAYKKAIVTIDEPFVWPKEPEWCQTSLKTAKINNKMVSRKMNGWRIRAPEDERVELKRLNDEAVAEQQAKQQKKKK